MPLAATPRLVVSPSTVGPLYVPIASSVGPQVVQASNAGDGTLSLQVTSSASWLSASIQGSTMCVVNPAQTCQSIVITFTTASLPAGTYTEWITVTAAGAIDSPLNIPVTVTIANVPASLAFYVTPNGTASAPIYPQNPINIAVGTATGGNWLSFSAPLVPFAFGVPYFINVTAQPSQIPGRYSGAATTSGSSSLSDNRTIAVSMTVTTSPIVQTPIPTVRMSGYQGGPKVVSNVTLSNMGLGTLTLTGASASSSSGNFLSAGVVSGSTLSITADPSGLAPGAYSGTITIASNAANSAAVSIPVDFAVATAGGPSISQGGIVNVADYSAVPVAQGDIIAVFGDQFTDPNASFTNPGGPPLATSLGNVQLLVNGVAAPLYYVSARQINAQMPYGAPPKQSALVQVISNGTAGNVRSVSVAAAQPHILIWPASVIRGNYATVVNSDGSLSLPTTAGYGASPSRPSRPGETVTIYCTGLGQTTPTATEGQAASSTNLMYVPNTTVTIGSSGALTPAFSGLTPTAVGLYQVNVTLPVSIAINSAATLIVSVNGVASNMGLIAISP
jgi:adhesin/invasin